MDLTPKPKNNPWNKLFGGFCDPNKENAEDSDDDENASAQPGVVRRSVSFSNQVTVSDGNSTPQAKSLNDCREARAIMNCNGTPPGGRVKSSPDPKQSLSENGSSFQSGSDPRQRPISNGEVKGREAPQTESKPQGILKPPAVATKKAKPKLASPRGRRIFELLFLTTLTLVAALSVLYFGLGYGLQVTFDSRTTKTSPPIRVFPKQQHDVEDLLVEDDQVGEEPSKHEVGVDEEEAITIPVPELEGDNGPDDEEVEEVVEKKKAAQVQYVSSSFAHEEEAPIDIDEYKQASESFNGPTEL